VSNAEKACLEFYIASRELLLIEGAWATRDRDVNVGRALNEATQPALTRLNRYVTEGQARAQYQADKEKATLRVKNAEFEIKNIGAFLYEQGRPSAVPR
jgi:hypothetical protein